MSVVNRLPHLIQSHFPVSVTMVNDLMSIEKPVPVADEIRCHALVVLLTLKSSVG